MVLLVNMQILMQKQDHDLIEYMCIVGMLLTLTDAGVRNIGLHGGKNLSHFVAATRQFVYR